MQLVSDLHLELFPGNGDTSKWSKWKIAQSLAALVTQNGIISVSNDDKW